MVACHHRERGQLGNRIAAMRGPLPTYIADPLHRLRFVSHAMAGLKESKQALGAEVIANVQNFAPPTILAQASRLNFSTRLFGLLGDFDALPDSDAIGEHIALELSALLALAREAALATTA